MRSSPSWLWVALVATGACTVASAPLDSGSPVACVDVDDPSLQVGTGTAVFEPLAADGPIGFYPGPQGGHHVFVSVRARGFVRGTPANLGYDDPVVSISLVTDRELSIYLDRQRSFDLDDDAIQFVGQLVRLFDSDPVALDGDPVTLSVDLEDRCGTRASAALDLRLELRDAP
ncbi:MAG: hypothetical protein AAF211_04750 [Myxococcota bacterium]